MCPLSSSGHDFRSPERIFSIVICTSNIVSALAYSFIGFDGLVPVDVIMCDFRCDKDSAGGSEKSSMDAYDARWNDLWAKLLATFQSETGHPPPEQLEEW